MSTVSAAHKCGAKTIDRAARARVRRAGLAIAMTTTSLLAVQAALPAAGQARTVSVAAKTAKPAKTKAKAKAKAVNTAAANKALVLSFNDQLFNQDNLAVIAQDTATTYKEHNPTVEDGQAGLLKLVQFLQFVAPDLHMYPKRAIAEGDLVLVQSESVPAPGVPGQSIIDIFRVTNGKIVEHWDNLQNVPASTVNGHDLFSTESQPRTSDPDPSASTKDSEKIVDKYFSDLTGKKHDSAKAVQKYVAPNLYQHDPAIADGAAATQQYYANLYRANPNATFTVARIVAEGDLVAIHSRFQKNSGDLGQSVVDIFRVKNKTIVEHWDGIEDVPATSVNGNGMF